MVKSNPLPDSAEVYYSTDSNTDRAKCKRACQTIYNDEHLHRRAQTQIHFSTDTNTDMAVLQTRIQPVRPFTMMQVLHSAARIPDSEWPFANISLSYLKQAG